MATRNQSPKYGVTLVEVLFAIGVILVGLVGLASVLPIAGRRAQDSVDLNEASAFATATLDELTAQGTLQPNTLVTRLDRAIGGFSVGATPTLSNVPPLPNAFSAPPGVTSWCVDPLFVSDGVSQKNQTNGGYFVPFDPNGGNGYRRILFPYYRAEHNPLTDPSGTFNTGTAWPLAPRMLRVGVGGPRGLVSAREAESIAELPDGLAVTKPDDNSLNVDFQTQGAIDAGQVSGLGGSSLIGKRLRDGSLTWIATCNRLQGTSYINVAIVILRNRDRSFYTYPVGTGSAAATAEDNAIAERLAYVSSANGFTGGAGGSVQIVAPANTASDLTVNDWVMLSRNPAGGWPVHRWYRVASVGQEAEEINFPDPVHGTDRPVWRHTLYLDGPDWSFGFSTPGSADGTVADNTYVTIVEDVVAVSEQTIRLP